MLYISTRNTVDTYTAYRALHEGIAPDGGSYIPFHLHVFSGAELLKMRENSCSDAIAEILNLFFGLRLTGFDVESAIGRTPFQIESLGQRLTVAEAWRNPNGNIHYLINNLYRLACGETYHGQQPAGWALIAIQIALLFGIYASMDVTAGERFDVAVPVGDFSDVVAVLYAKSMGLPIGLTICACNEDGAIWDFIYRGQLSTNGTNASFLEIFIQKLFGADAAKCYVNASSKGQFFYINELQQQTVTDYLYASVVSTGRIDSVISGMYQSNKYYFDRNAALSFAALQDYRAHNGRNRETLILAKKRTS